MDKRVTYSEKELDFGLIIKKFGIAESYITLFYPLYLFFHAYIY